MEFKDDGKTLNFENAMRLHTDNTSIVSNIAIDKEIMELQEPLRSSGAHWMLMTFYPVMRIMLSVMVSSIDDMDDEEQVDVSVWYLIRAFMSCGAWTEHESIES